MRPTESNLGKTINTLGFLALLFSAGAALYERGSTLGLVWCLICVAQSITVIWPFWLGSRSHKDPKITGANGAWVLDYGWFRGGKRPVFLDAHLYLWADGENKGAEVENDMVRLIKAYEAKRNLDIEEANRRKDRMALAENNDNASRARALASGKSAPQAGRLTLAEGSLTGSTRNPQREALDQAKIHSEHLKQLGR